MHRSVILPRAATLTLALGAAACAELAGPPTAPGADGLRVTTRIECVGSTTTRTVRCAEPAPATVTMPDDPSGSRIAVSGPVRDVILGNQGGYVKLTSSNVSAGGGVFSFDVTVQNRIVQPIGTTTGSNVAPSGIRVFFATGPQVLTGTGTMDFDNGSGGFYHDGTGTFTNANQPYFQYTERLANGEVSSPKTWRLRFDPTVLTFSFTLYVSAPVQFPDGYVSGNPNVVTLNPGEQSVAIGGSVRNAVNRVIGGPITYTSLDPSIATVNASGVVTGGPSRGITYVELQSGIIPNYISSAVNVCADTPTITSGASINGTIDASDCYSGFATAQGRPDPNYLSDMFRISLTAGQQVTITLTADATFSPFLTLVDPLGVVERATIGGGFGTTATISGHSVQRSGVYIIEAGQDNLTLGGNYALNVTVIP